MTKLPDGTAHKLPRDFAQAITGSQKSTSLWLDITPLARNEWICWVTSGAKTETRIKRIKAGLDKMSSGERRPCCWQGCSHRKDKPPSRTVRQS